eukprot:COSAG06_NODE_41196_length_393_cov_53.108844_2_plen_58_part_01
MMDTTENKKHQNNRVHRTQVVVVMIDLREASLPSAASSHACPEPVLARIMDIVFSIEK